MAFEIVFDDQFNYGANARLSEQPGWATGEDDLRCTSSGTVKRWSSTSPLGYSGCFVETYPDGEYDAEFRLATHPNDNTTDWAGLIYDYVDDQNFYQYRIYLNSIRLRKCVNGVYSDLSNNSGYTGYANIRWKLQRRGNLHETFYSFNNGAWTTSYGAVDSTFPPTGRVAILLFEQTRIKAEVDYLTIYAEPSTEILLAADDVVGQAAIQSGAITQTHPLVTGDLNAECDIQSGAVGQHQVLTSGHLELYNTIQSAAVLQTHPLETSNLDGENAVQSAALGQQHPLETGNLDGENAIQSAAISAPKILGAESLSGATAIQSGSLTQTHLVLSNSLRSRGVLQSAALDAQNHQLLSGQLNSTGTIQQQRIYQTAPLLTDALNSIGKIQSAAVATVHDLQTTPLDISGNVQEGAVGVTHALVAANAGSIGDIQSGEIAIPFGITAVYSEESGIRPLYWGEPAVITGKFGTTQGLVFFGDVEGVVTLWEDAKIVATVVQGSQVNGLHDVHVDRVS